MNPPIPHGGLPPSSRHYAAATPQHRLVWTRFRRHKLARLGTWILAGFALLGIFADFLSSDLPIACRLHGKVYLFANLTHPAALFHYDNERIEREKEPGDWSIPTPVGFGPYATPSDESLKAPRLGSGHPFGTDRHGRDVFARLIHGIRTTLGIGIATTMVFVGLGVCFGALAGFFGGVVDKVVTRFVEVLAAFPPLLFVMVVQALLRQPTPLVLIVALALTRWTEVARLVRAEVLQAVSSEYVLAARALGASPWRVLRRHILPNSVVPAWINATYGFASVVLLEASIHFLRGTVSPSILSWGEIMSEARRGGGWWLFAFPGVSIVLVVSALNLIGEAIRDAFDPRLQTGRNVRDEAAEIPFASDHW